MGTCSPRGSRALGRAGQAARPRRLQLTSRPAASDARAWGRTAGRRHHRGPGCPRRRPCSLRCQKEKAPRSGRETCLKFPTTRQLARSKQARGSAALWPGLQGQRVRDGQPESSRREFRARPAALRDARQGAPRGLASVSLTVNEVTARSEGSSQTTRAALTRRGRHS